MSSANLDSINEAITDRSNCFYWQGDRNLDPAEAGKIFANRHAGISEDEIKRACGTSLSIDPDQVKPVPWKEEHQNNLGNVNVVRTIEVDDGRRFVLRAHPKGLKNGYFWVEALASKTARAHKVPTYHTIDVRDLNDPYPFAYMLIEEIPGVAMKKHLDDHPEDEAKLLFDAGKVMAGLHKVKVEGFGFFDNDQAREGKLVGIKASYRDHIFAGLDFNLDYLVKQNIVSEKQAEQARKLFETSELLECEQATIVHNDFADWNLITDGEHITGVIDWDEAHAGHPIGDIACWSTFFDPKRLDEFLKGYKSVTELSNNFQDTFELLRMRYTIAKMTLRLRRLEWDDSEEVKEKVKFGTQHLQASLKYFEM
jgi:aminoglycoside phosphotransferase (APT) family kinase protein